MVSDTLLSEIHAQFRRQMNADISLSLRRHGLDYRTIFGVPSMRLKEVAEQYAPSAELAEALWAEDIRESKMLATRLYPPHQMDEAGATRWVNEIRHTEIADQACMNLFAHVTMAKELCMQWLHEDENSCFIPCYCGLKLAARLPQDQWSKKEIDTIIQRAQTLLSNEETHISLKTAAHWAIENLTEI